ncbi:MAG: colicin V production protein [Salinivirgaceae bacterium]|nr:MAG: colicin V production protein [Salinivirgaceae bacterium]
MNIFDLAIAIPLVWGLYKGFSKGFIQALATLVALVLGVIGAIKFSDITSTFLASNLNIEPTYLPLISFAITFIGIIIGVHFLARLIDKLLKAVALGLVNKLAGAAFGLAKYAFIVSVILIALNYINGQTNFIPKEKIESSLLYEPVSKFAPTIIPYVNLDTLRQRVDDKVKLPESLNDSI